MTGHSETLEPELGRLSTSQDTGPLASLAAAELLSYFSPPLSKYFANLGLRNLSAAAFAKDVQVLFDPNIASGQIIAVVTKNAQNLSAADIETLKTVLPSNVAKPILAGIEELQTRKDSPPEVALPPALGKIWDAGLETAVEAKLRQLANPPAATQP